MTFTPEDIIGRSYDGYPPHQATARERITSAGIGGGIVTLALMGGGVLVFALLVIGWAVRVVAR